MTFEPKDQPEDWGKKKHPKQRVETNHRVFVRLSVCYNHLTRREVTLHLFVHFVYELSE